jgi:hypothetical protein
MCIGGTSAAVGGWKITGTAKLRPGNVICVFLAGAPLRRFHRRDRGGRRRRLGR